MYIGFKLHEVSSFLEPEYSIVKNTSSLTAHYMEQVSNAIASLGSDHECNSLILIPEPIWEFSF